MYVVLSMQSWSKMPINKTPINKAARLVYECGWDQPSGSLLTDLHWLPVKERICFKMLIWFTYNMVFLMHTAIDSAPNQTWPGSPFLDPKGRPGTQPPQLLHRACWTRYQQVWEKLRRWLCLNASSRHFYSLNHPNLLLLYVYFWLVVCPFFVFAFVLVLSSLC